MTATTPTLEQALQFATAPPAAPAAPLSAVWEGRTIHWSTGLLSLGAVCSLITLIAGVALSQTPLMITGGFYLTLSLTGAYYTHTFSQYRSLESHVKILANQVLDFQKLAKETEENQERAKNDIQELYELRRLAQQGTERERVALERQEADFRKILEEYKKVEALLKKQLSEVNVKLSQKTADFERETGKLDKILSSYRTALETLQLQVEELKKENSDLLQHTKELETLRNSYAEKTQAYDRENDELKDSLKKLSTTLSNPGLNLKRIDERAENLAKSTESLQKTAAQLEKLAQKLEKLKSQGKKP